MRIAHIGIKGLPSQGGTERVVEAITAHHVGAHDVTVYGSRLVCPGGIVNGVRVISLPALPAKHLGPVCLQSLAALHAVFLGRYDVVHLHGSENSFVLPLLRLRYPVVTTGHGPTYRRAKWGPLARRLIFAVERLSVLWASAATSVARSQAEELSRRYGRPVRYIPNGLDVSAQPDVEAARRLLAEWGVGEGAFWLFAAARIDPTKGCLTLIEALRRLPDAPPLVVVGDLSHAPGHGDQLHAAAKGLDVRFAPRISDKATVLGVAALAGLFIFPSTIEAMSMMLLEALSVGVPVVASDIPENTAVLPEYVHTFRAGDVADLARVLAGLTGGIPRDLGAQPHEGLAEIAERHDWEVIARQYLAVYESVIRSCT